eukprot:3841735-Amphidinium_carterae.1
MVSAGAYRCAIFSSLPLEAANLRVASFRRVAHTQSDNNAMDITRYAKLGKQVLSDSCHDGIIVHAALVGDPYLAPWPNCSTHTIQTKRLQYQFR